MKKNGIFYSVICLNISAAIIILSAVINIHSSADIENAKTNPIVHDDGANVYSSHKNQGEKIALTFDDGPHPRHTKEILDILEEYKVPATFFVIGKNAEKHPDIIRRQIREGHEIGNHTENHTCLSKSSESSVLDEISKAEETLYEISDYRPKLIRPPGGFYNKTVCRAANQMDYNIILWTIDTKDWAHTPADVISKGIFDKIKCGDIILMHDFIAGDSPTPDVLRTIIPTLLKDGYKFVTVSELIMSN